MSRSIPSCNRSFLIEALLDNKRLDGRSLHQFRDLQVNYGQTFGSCYVQLGHTVIFASTEATVEEPRVTRPSEGRFKVSINVCAGGKERWLKAMERSQPKEGVLAMRQLEKIINRINVLDLESLCLVTGSRVWCICTNLVLLNFDGNLIEAASIATIASLMHFKRPDATVTPEGDIIIHTLEERPPIPLTLFHYPICVTFQFMDHTLLERIMSENQEIFPEQHRSRVRKATQLMVCDPTEEEEDFLKNVFVVCANTYREIVAIQSLGRLSLTAFSKELLDSCTFKAFERVKFVTDYLKSAIEMHNSNNNQRNKVASLQRYDFYEALRNGDLCTVKDYRHHPIFGKGNSFIVPEEDEETNREQTAAAENGDNDGDDDVQLIEEDGTEINESKISDFLQQQRKAIDNVGVGGLSCWDLKDDLANDEDDSDNEGNSSNSRKQGSNKRGNNSYAHILGYTNNNNNRNSQARKQVPKLAHRDDEVEFLGQSSSNQPQPPQGPETSNVERKDEWIKVDNRKLNQPNQSATTDNNNLNQSGGKKKRRNRNKNKKAQQQQQQQQKLPANLKMPITISSDEDGDDDVVVLSSEYSKK